MATATMLVLSRIPRLDLAASGLQATVQRIM